MNGWAAVEEGKFTYDAATDSATLTITIEADVEFKVTVGPDWAIEFNAGTAIFNAEQFADNNGNIKCIAAGTYVLTITDVTKDVRSLTIVAAE